MYIDEDAYLQRAMIVLEGHGPRDTTFQYDHPYFGQLFLAGIFRLIAYPDSFISSMTTNGIGSIENLHMVPRVLMGILAVIDTFLVYKISERRYNRNVAIIASVLFAVMPMTWLLRRILLDSLLLPFLLSSILFALYAKDSTNISTTRKNVMILLSGIFLGLAIFTKIPAFTMIPLVVFLLVYTYQESNRCNSILKRRLAISTFSKENMKTLGLWLIPVVFIPLIWPLHALFVGEFNDWLNGIYYQTHRDPHKEQLHVLGIGSMFDEIIVLLQIDPVLLLVGFFGVFFAVLRKDLFFLLWIIPFLLFLYREGFVQYFYYIPLLPALCIAAARLIDYLSKLIMIHYKKEGARERLLPFIVVSGIGIFGLANTILLITTTLNSSYFEALAFVDKYISHNNNSINSSGNYKNDLTIISDLRYSWIPQYVLHEDYHYKRFWDIDPIKTEKVLLIFQDDFLDTFLNNKFKVGNENLRGSIVYNNTFGVAAFNGNRIGAYNSDFYPYDSLRLNALPEKIELRTNTLFLNSSGFVVPIDQKGPKVTDVNNALEISVPINQPTLPMYWNDSFKNCEHLFKCTITITSGWSAYDSGNTNINNKTAFYVSTSSTDNYTWSWIYGKEISVKPQEQYQLVTHMKLNRYTMQSHIALEGYNNNTKQWDEDNQLIQCPVGTNGPLEWKEFRCDITIPANTIKIRPILNAGWSSQPGKQAVTLFDDIEAFTNKTTHNIVSNPDFRYFDDSVSIMSLCQLRGDFDVQVDYRLIDWPQSNGVGLGIFAKEFADNRIYDNLLKSVERVSMGRGTNFPVQATELYRTHFSDGIHQITATHQTNSKTVGNMLGKLRMERSGFRITGYYYSFGKWIPIHSDVGTIPVDLAIVLRAGAGQYGLMHHPVKIDLLNYLVNKGQLVNCQAR